MYAFLVNWFQFQNSSIKKLSAIQVQAANSEFQFQTVQLKGASTAAVPGGFA